MDYIIIGLLVILLILVVISLMKNINESNITERLGKLETEVIRELGEFKIDLNKGMNEDFNSLNEKMEEKLRMINDRVNERLDENFEKTNKTFTSVLERLSKIDEAQKKIDLLSNDIVSLQSVLTDKKTRGIFGEANLSHIMSSVFGEHNDKIYQLQYSFENGTIADCVLFAPEPLGTIAIDSKFPLEHYRIMVDKSRSNASRVEAEKQFKQDMKSILMRLHRSILFLELLVIKQFYFYRQKLFLQKSMHIIVKLLSMLINEEFGLLPRQL